MEGLIVVRLLSRPVISIALCCLLALGFISYAAYSSVVAQQLTNWKVLPRPERVTELSFLHSNQLPDRFRDGDIQTFSFRVHNLEHRATTYHFTVKAIAAEQEQLLTSGSVTLPDEAARNITQTVIVPALNRRVQVEVRLRYEGIGRGQDAPSSQTQAIRYWLDKIDGKKGDV